MNAAEQWRVARRGRLTVTPGTEPDANPVRFSFNFTNVAPISDPAPPTDPTGARRVGDRRSTSDGG